MRMENGVIESAFKRGLSPTNAATQSSTCVLSLVFCLCFCADVPAYKTTEKICQQTLTLTGFILHSGREVSSVCDIGKPQQKSLEL